LPALKHHFSTGPLAPAGLYAATVKLYEEEDSRQILKNHLFFPKVFAPWFSLGRKEQSASCFVAAFDRAARTKAYCLDAPLPADLECQISRIYRDRDWEVLKQQLPSDSLRLAERQGKRVTVQDSSLNVVLNEAEAAEKRGEYLTVEVEHIFGSKPLVPDMISYDDFLDLSEGDQLQYYPAIDCYVWYERGRERNTGRGGASRRQAHAPASFGPSTALRLLPSRALPSATADRIVTGLNSKCQLWL